MYVLQHFALSPTPNIEAADYLFNNLDLDFGGKIIRELGCVL